MVGRPHCGRETLLWWGDPAVVGRPCCDGEARFQILVLGPRSLILGSRSLILGSKSSELRSLILGIKSVFLGPRSLILGAKF